MPAKKRPGSRRRRRWLSLAHPRPSVASRWTSYRWLMINTIAWGASFVVVKPAFEATTPMRFMLYRFLIAVIFSAPILWSFVTQLGWPKIRSYLPSILKLELFGTVVALSFLTWA